MTEPTRETHVKKPETQMKISPDLVIQPLPESSESNIATQKKF